jgi:hypothetical protein
VTETVAPGPAIPIDNPGRTPVVVTVAPGPSAIAAGPDSAAEFEVATPPFCAIARERLVGAASALALASKPYAAAAPPAPLVAEHEAPLSEFWVAAGPGAGHPAGAAVATGVANSSPSDAAPAPAVNPIERVRVSRFMTFSFESNGLQGFTLRF